MFSTLITDDTTELGSIIKKGGIVIFPTETVYGIGADSTNSDACKKIYEIKQRPLDNPLIAHFDSINQIESYCILPDIGKKILTKFSPGPLTLVLKVKNLPIFTLGLDTLAVRIPSHEAARALIQRAGVPISAPSANPSGRPSFTREKDVIEFYDGKVDGILLAPEPTIGIESTVLDLSKDEPILLRPGQITWEDLHPFFPNLKQEALAKQSQEIRSPGMKYRHYSPDAKVMVLETLEFQNVWDAKKLDSKCAFIGFQLDSPRKVDKKISDNRDYMKSLYAFFLDADTNQAELCFCEVPKKDSFYSPLMNRLSKAVSKI